MENTQEKALPTAPLSLTCTYTAWGSAPWTALSPGWGGYSLLAVEGSRSWSVQQDDQDQAKERDLSRMLRSTVQLILLAWAENGMDLCVNSKIAKRHPRGTERNPTELMQPLHSLTVSV